MNNRYAMRRRRLMKQLKSFSLDLFLVTDPINVRYLSGFTGEDGYLLVHGDEAILVSDSRFETYMAEEMPNFPVYIRRRGEGMVAACAKLILERTAPQGLLGVESDAVSLTLASWLESSLPNLKILPVSGAVEILREVKDRTEIAAVRRSAKSAIAAFRAVQQSAQPNWTEIDIRNEIDYRMRCAGAEDSGFPTIAAVGERAALPHAVPSGKRLAEGESLLIDWGAKRDGYISDLTRVLITVPNPSDRLRAIYKTVLSAQKAAIRAIRPGITADRVDRAARRIIERAGFGDAFNHSLGHGLGLVVHDRGGFSIGNKTPLVPGMILTVEPGIYLPGELGIRIEDDILITPDGCEVLTQELPSDLDAMFLGCL